MRGAPHPADEPLRLESLHRLGLLDTSPEERFDRITRLARQFLRAPVAALSFVDSDRVWFKSVQGLPASEIPRDTAFCGFVILGEGPFVVPDTSTDERFHDHPMLVEQNVRCYVGHPVRSPDGRRVGVLSVLDHRPHQPSAEQLGALRDLAHLVESEIRYLEMPQLEQALREIHTARVHAEEDRNRFFSLSLDMLCIAGFDGYFKQLNPSWERVLGHSLEELLSKPFVDFVHPDDRERAAREASKIAEGWRSVSFENRYRTKSGEYRWLRWTATPATERKMIYAAARDITEQKEMEERLRRGRDEAEAANQSKNEFLAKMSHELRTPLNAVIGFASLLRQNEDGRLTVKDVGYLARIQDNGEHLLGLINTILDLSKVEAGRIEIVRETVDVGALVADTTCQFEADLADKQVELKTVLPPEVPPGGAVLPTDRARLRQILLNLVGNACKFTEAGEVRVELVLHEDTGVPARIVVADTGIGIEEAQLGAIFESFRQVHTGSSRKFGGSGLGLAISLSLAELLGFRLDVESRLGEGSAFTLHFPPAGEARALPDSAPG